LKFWIAGSFTDTDHLVPFARKAEEVGFEGVFLADHLVVPEKIESKYPYAGDGAPPFDRDVHHPDVWASMTAMAMATSRLRLSVATFVLPLHDVFDVARGAATASIFSGGRVHFSVGAGWMKEEFDIVGIDFASRGRRMDEMIEVLRKLWRGTPVEHHGAFYDFPPLSVRPAPPEPVPILVAGATPAALRRAARLGDGWIGPGSTPDEAETILGELSRLRAEAGRGEEPFEIIVPLTSEPDAAVYERLEALGATATVSWPASLAMGIRHPTLEQELEYLEGFAEQVIGRFAS
jgi:probable F420-dependent oxidoreductase